MKVINDNQARTAEIRKYAQRRKKKYSYSQENRKEYIS